MTTVTPEDLTDETLFLVQLICCGSDDGVFGPVPWNDADRFRESYCSGPGVSDSGGHIRSGIIVAASDAFWSVPVHWYPPDAINARKGV